MNCRKFRDDLQAHLSGELPEERSLAMEAHREDCVDCAARALLESGFRHALSRRLARVAAPPELMARVRAALAAEAQAEAQVREPLSATPEMPAPPPAPRPWLGRVAIAAALLGAVALTIGFTRRPGAAVAVDRTVVVVDYDCDRAGKTLAEQRKCAHPEHLNALRVADGHWNVSLEREEGRRIAVDRELRGREVRVVGEYYPKIRTVRIRDFRELETSRQARALAP